MWIDSNDGYVNRDHVRIIQPSELGNGNWVLHLVTDIGQHALPHEYPTRASAQDAALKLLTGVVSALPA